VIDPVAAVVIVPGRRWNRTARVSNAVTGTSLPALEDYSALVWSAAFSTDGTRVVTASFDDTAQIWDVATGKWLVSPLGHQNVVWSAEFSRDGTRVVTASEDKTARVWDAATGKPLSPALEHQGTVWSAAFSPDGTRVVTASDDGTARVWDLPLAPGTLAEWCAIADRASPYAIVNGILSPRPENGPGACEK
jgi:WD40 repeat protein